MSRYFCTYFDRHYLARGLALYSSVKKHCASFTLWVLCMDSASYAILEELKLPHLHLITLKEFETGDDELIQAKQNRSRIEYYFTCTSSLPLFILRNYEEVDLITYLDADLFFFSDPEPIFEEVGETSVAITPHRFPPMLQHLAIFGIFNVGWLSFRHDVTGLACLRSWRKNCLEWCYDRVEGSRFADQKYLDDWPQQFQDVFIIQHKGANVAPWNIANYRIKNAEDKVWVDDQPLIFFHFHGLRQIKGCLYDPGFVDYHSVLSLTIRWNIYKPYIKSLLKMDQMIKAALTTDAKRQTLAIQALRTHEVRPRSFSDSLKRLHRLVAMRSLIFALKDFVI